MKITLELIERFHEKWKVNPESGCWEWTASVDGNGYGQIKRPKERRQIKAPRLSYLIHHKELPDDKVVCHTCDNPLCVKPSHLFLGTLKDNSQDMKSKDRHLAGNKHPNAKLDEDKVRRIHELYKEGVSQGKLGKTFGVSQGTIFKIVHGERWEYIYKQIHG